MEVGVRPDQNRNWRSGIEHRSRLNLIFQAVEFAAIGGSGSGSLRGETRGETIDGLAHLIQLHHPDRIEWYHAQPLAAEILHQALTLEQMQRVADRLPRDIEHIGQRGLADALA